MSKGPGKHHGQAAYHHESATRHHRAAEKAYGSGDHKTAAHEAQCASGHAQRANHHADLAAADHMEHHGMTSAAACDCHTQHPAEAAIPTSAGGRRVRATRSPAPG